MTMRFISRYVRTAGDVGHGVRRTPIRAPKPRTAVEQDRVAHQLKAAVVARHGMPTGAAADIDGLIAGLRATQAILALGRPIPDAAFTCEAIDFGDYRFRRNGRGIPILWNALERLFARAGVSLHPGQRVIVPSPLGRLLVQRALRRLGRELRHLQRAAHLLRLKTQGIAADPSSSVIGAWSAIQSATNRVCAKQEQLHRAIAPAAGGRPALTAAA